MKQTSGLPEHYGPKVQPMYLNAKKIPSYSKYNSFFLRKRVHKQRIEKTTELETTIQRELDSVRQIIKLKHYEKRTEELSEESIELILRNNNHPSEIFVEQVPDNNYTTMQVNVYTALPGAEVKQIASYNVPVQDYPDKRSDDIEDTTRFLPVKNQIFEFMPDGLFGYTSIGSDKVYINQRLFGEKKEETIVHESIHTPDEYETRVITSWILNKETSKYQMRTMFINHETK